MSVTTNKQTPSHTLSKGFRILEAFTKESTTELSNAELCLITRLNKSTVSRLTKNLCDLGYLQHSKETGKFSPSIAILSLAYPILANLPVRRIAHPLLQDLAEMAHGVACLGMRHGLDLVLIESCRKLEFLSTRPEVGARRPLHSGWLGEIYLAGLPVENRNAIFEEMRDKKIPGLSKLKDAVAANAIALKTNGYCSTTTYGNSGVASIFRISKDGEIGTISCAVEDAVVPKEQIFEAIPKRMLGVVASIEEALGVRTSRYSSAWS